MRDDFWSTEVVRDYSTKRNVRVGDWPMADYCSKITKIRPTKSGQQNPATRVPPKIRFSRNFSFERIQSIYMPSGTLITIISTYMCTTLIENIRRLCPLLRWKFRPLLSLSFYLISAVKICLHRSL